MDVGLGDWDVISRYSTGSLMRAGNLKRDRVDCYGLDRALVSTVMNSLVRQNVRQFYSSSGNDVFSRKAQLLRVDIT
jgi:hypothetical protein